MAIWVVLFTEFNFTAEHKLGAQYKSTDGLSYCTQEDSGDRRHFPLALAIDSEKGEDEKDSK